MTFIYSLKGKFKDQVQRSSEVLVRTALSLEV